MAKRIMIEEIHLHIFAPAGLPPARYVAMHRTLVGKRFLSRLKRAIQDMVRQFASLNQTRITITR
jgi:hypothetical protein